MNDNGLSTTPRALFFSPSQVDQGQPVTEPFWKLEGLAPIKTEDIRPFLSGLSNNLALCFCCKHSSASLIPRPWPCFRSLLTKALTGVTPESERLINQFRGFFFPPPHQPAKLLQTNDPKKGGGRLNRKLCTDLDVEHRLLWFLRPRLFWKLSSAFCFWSLVKQTKSFLFKLAKKRVVVAHHRRTGLHHALLSCARTYIQQLTTHT